MAPFPYAVVGSDGAATAAELRGHLCRSAGKLVHCVDNTSCPDQFPVRDDRPRGGGSLTGTVGVHWDDGLLCGLGGIGDLQLLGKSPGKGITRRSPRADGVSAS